MQLFINTGANGSATYEVQSSDSISSLKAQIENQTFFTNFRLMSSGKQLVDTQLVGECLTEAASVEVQFDLAGGMRAKWRKKRMRRLRRKRRKMRQRAR